jgi:hypothetical protein
LKKPILVSYDELKNQSESVPVDQSWGLAEASGLQTRNDRVLPYTQGQAMCLRDKLETKSLVQGTPRKINVAMSQESHAASQH